MMKKNLFMFCLVTAVATPSIGCKAPTQEEPASSANPSAEVSSRIETALGDYEALRAALAGDRLNEVEAIATRLENSTREAKGGVPASVASRLKEMGTAVTRLKAGGSADDQRRTFGDLSQAVVSLLSEHSALARGRYVFQCPMAQGYQKWVQTSDKLENPYMGARMLRCGSKASWSHAQ
jgi:Cu(I)/Ag(I) efflux system membrane fusion protein